MLTADEGAEDERELLAERRARLQEMVGRCKPQIEQARRTSLFGLFALDPEQLYRLACSRRRRCSMAKRWLARLWRLVRSPMCPHCRVRHPVDSRSADFLLCDFRAERRWPSAELLARRARSTRWRRTSDGAAQLTFDAFSDRLCTSLIAALDLTIDQADGSRPMTVDELRHYTGHRP